MLKKNILGTREGQSSTKLKC